MIQITLDPIVAHWGPILISWHGLFLTAGVIAAYQVVARTGTRRGVAPHHFQALIVWAALLGYAGARVLHVVDAWALYAGEPVRILEGHQGGLALYGALIGGTVAVLLYCRWQSLPFWTMADLIALGIPVGEIVGRFGCTLNGDVWGLATNQAWGIVYWHPAAAVPRDLLGVPTFPAPTAIQVWCTALLGVLLLVRRRPLPPGVLFLTCALGYSLGRFCIACWQPGRAYWLNLDQTQVVAAGVILLAAGLLLCRIRLVASAPVTSESVQQADPCPGV